jgi:type VI secretion system protein ImpL
VNGIQSSFFADTPDQLGIVFRLQPYSMDATLHRATFTLGDTQVEYRHGPIMIKEFRWPVAAEHSVASLVTERFDGNAVGFKEAAGAWSLFRLLDRMESEPHRGMEIKVLKAEVAGARVNYLLTTRLPDPFDPETLRGFALPMAL